MRDRVPPAGVAAPTAELLTAALWVLLATLLLFALISMLAIRSHIAILLALAAVAFDLLALLLARLGRVTAAGLLLCSMLWVLLTGVTVGFEGTNSPAFFGYPAVVLLAAVVLGRGGSIAFAAASLVVALAVAVAESLGWLPPSLGPNLPVARWAALATYVALAAALVAVALRNMNQALTRAHDDETALRESESRFRRLLENAPDIIFRWTAAEGVEYISPSVEPILGFTPREAVEPQNWRERLMPEAGAGSPGRSEWISAMLAAVLPAGGWARGSTGEHELLFRRKDGSTAHLEGRFDVQQDPDGNPLVVEGILRDVSQRRLAEEQLHERAARLDLLSRLGQEAAGLPGAEELLHRAAELIASALRLYNVVVFLVDSAELVMRACSLPEARTLLDRVRLPIGPGSISGWVAASASPLVVEDTAGDPRYRALLPQVRTRSEMAVPMRVKSRVTGVLDVQSEEPRAFTAIDVRTLQTVADQLAIALENARLYEEARTRADRLAVINRIGRAAGATLDLDRLMERLYEGAAASLPCDAFFVALYDAPTRTLDFRIQVDEGVRSAPERQILGPGLTSRVITTRRPLRILDFDGERGQLPEAVAWGSMRPPGSWLGVPMVIGDRIVGVMSVQSYRLNAYTAEDVQLLATLADQAAAAVENARLYAAVQQELVERGRLEAQLVQAQKMEAVGRLAGGVAHDFNNLLTAVEGYTDLILLDADEETRPHLEEIKTVIRRGAALTRQLLAFSRKQILRLERVDLNAVIRDTGGLLRRLLGEDMELVTCLAPDLWLVEADVGQITQVLLNLAVNARDAMAAGGRLVIETANVSLDGPQPESRLDISPGSYARLTVSDTGTGMSEDVQQHLFEPFFTTKEMGKGTGLGLATVHGIVEQSHGGIEVSSAPGEGSTFRVYLPRLPAAQPGGQAPQETPPAHGCETLLVVEDEEALQHILRQLLTRYGYHVLTAGDTQGALDASDSHPGPIPLLVTDVVIPGGMNGRELARKLRERRPEMRVLYVSGYTEDAYSREAALRQGVQEKGIAFLQKPFRPPELLERIRTLLEQPDPGPV